MSGHVRLHAMERAIRQMAYGGVLDLERRRAEFGYDQLSELEHQFQLPLDGTADAVAAWVDFDIDFDVEFYYAPEQRDSPLTVPHYTWGAVISTATGGAGGVFISPFVTGWKEDAAREAVVGAAMRIGVWVDTGPVDFAGYLHVTFQGYGAVAENGNDDGGHALDVT